MLRSKVLRSPVLRSTASCLFALGCLIGIGSAARAADPGQAPDIPSPQVPQGWIVKLTANGAVGPQYLGSKNYGFTPYPSIGFRRVGTPETFSAPDDGIGFDLSPMDWLRFGPVVRYQGGRYLSGNPELRGLHKVPWTLQGGGFVELWPSQHIRARAELVHGFRAGDGFAAYLSADWVERLGKWTLSGGPRLSLEGTKDMRTRFGVTFADALNNALVAPYRPNGGLSGAGLAAAATYQWNDQWAASINGGYQRLIGDAGKSPIVTKLGSRDEFSLGARLSYSFGVSW
ncbi:Outer membrane scaffolding protein for murein synthesis, MipA/OmpV family [Rhizobiales bacterium GAS191]|nr:Outer membrane scaffolding protein for murein synthesis, MipA/OmpV family [Rhizobiales bacterium GAS113]SEE38417.1 Outer membrane scaffolding protein for murein synthesis, MipA/OmpV family [Rhizobiales bacterium GAS191]